MDKILKILCILTLLALPVSGWAGQSPLAPASTLKALVDEALAHNPQLKASRDQWQAAQKRIAQASALPDPTAGYSFMGSMIETRNGPEKERYEFEQMIPFPGKLIAQRNAVRAEAAAAQAKMNAVEREVIFKVRVAYYDLITTQKTIAIVGEIKDALKQVQSSAKAGYETNKIMQNELLKAQTAIAENTQRLFELEQKRDTLKVLLQSLLNRPLPVEVPSEDFFTPTLNFSWEEIRQKAQESRPELKESVAMAKKSEHLLSLAKLQNVPDVSVGFAYSRIGAGETNSAHDGQDAWMIPVKITLPIWQNRIGSAIEEARANLNAAQAQLKESENSTEYEVKAAYYRFITAQKIVSLYKNVLLPQAQLMISSDQAGYEAGRTGVTGFVFSQINFFNTQIAYYEALANAFKELAALQKEVGQDLTPGESL